MTEADLIRLLSERFHGNFADETARRVRDAGAVDLLYAVVTAPHPELPGPVRQKVLFRGAYVLERIYFDAPEAFMPRAESFCRSISRRAPTPARSVISGRSWPTCWGVMRPNPAIWSGSPKRPPDGPCRRRRKSP